MDTWKDRVLAVIEARAWARAAACSCELANADPAELEGIRAELEYEHWLAENCREARMT